MNCQMFSTGLSSEHLAGSGSDERAGHMPTGLIHEHDGMGTRRHGLGDFGKMQGHRVGIADRQDKPCALAQGRADRSEYIA